MDLVSSKSLSKRDKLTKATNPVTVSTANGVTTAEQEWKGHVPMLEHSVDAIVLENSVCDVLSLGELCVDKGYSLTWNKGKLPTLTGRDGRRIPLEVHSYVPMLKNEVDKSHIVQEMVPGSEGQEDNNPENR